MQGVSTEKFYPSSFFFTFLSILGSSKNSRGAFDTEALIFIVVTKFSFRLRWSETFYDELRAFGVNSMKLSNLKT